MSIECTLLAGLEQESPVSAQLSGLSPTAGEHFMQIIISFKICLQASSPSPHSHDILDEPNLLPSPMPMIVEYHAWVTAAPFL